MGLCEAITALTDALAANCKDLDSRQRLRIHVIRSILIYRDARRIDAWDQAIRDVFGNERSVFITDQLIEEIADLGRLNLYGAFDVTETLNEYRRIVQRFKAEGISTPPIPDFSDW
ncbi:MAG: hypothetical protein Q8K78_09575 [Planctomycetaceae bacterium]|nr:hypothetical protein [Planctomycetaceae bacterium]